MGRSNHSCYCVNKSMYVEYRGPVCWRFAACSTASVVMVAVSIATGCHDNHCHPTLAGAVVIYLFFYTSRSCNGY